MLESRIAKFNEQINKANTLRKWYQDLIFKIVRDFDIFKDQDKKTFEDFDQNEKDFGVQEKIQIKLNDMGIKVAINEMHKKYYGVLEGIERVKK